MGSVTNLAEYRDRKPKLPVAHTHTRNDLYRFPKLPSFKVAAKEPMSEAEMRLLVIEARINCYELAGFAPKISQEEFQARWPLFIKGLDEYEERANALVTLYWKCKGGCRPSQALFLREERDALRELLERNKTFWWEHPDER